MQIRQYFFRITVIILLAGAVVACSKSANPTGPYPISTLVAVSPVGGTETGTTLPSQIPGLGSTPGSTSTSAITATPTPTPTGTLSPTPTQTLTPVPTPVISNGKPVSWSLLFSDEFNGSQLDSNKWTTCYWWDKNGCTIASNQELEWYQPQNVSLNGGVLDLEARKQNIVGSDGRVYPYTSGMVTTGRSTDDLSHPVKFGFTYGFVEIRADAPVGKGLWPAFWMLPTNNQSRPEIDVMEIIGDQPGTINISIHYPGVGNSDQRIGQTCNGTNYTVGWHTFGLDWEPTSITWYVDGKQCWQYTDINHIPSQSMYLLLNLAVGGFWPGAPDGNTEFPSDFKIDYVRVWQRVN